MCSSDLRVLRPAGRRETIPAKMMREMPLPMPFSVMDSPSHIRKAVPAVRMMVVTMMLHTPGLIMALWR